jgi:hypothetical protein
LHPEYRQLLALPVPSDFEIRQLYHSQLYADEWSRFSVLARTHLSNVVLFPVMHFNASTKSRVGTCAGEVLFAFLAPPPELGHVLAVHDIAFVQPMSADFPQTVLQGVIAEVTFARVVVRMQEEAANCLTASNTCNLLFTLNRTRFIKQHAAIDRIPTSFFLPSVTALSVPVSVSYPSPDLDEHQSKALHAALTLSESSVLVVSGPMGSGKTKTMIEIVRKLVASGGRALVVFPTYEHLDACKARFIDIVQSHNLPSEALMRMYGLYSPLVFVFHRMRVSHSW